MEAAGTATQNGTQAAETTKGEYVVLLCTDDGRKSFSVVASVKASNAEQAIKGVGDRALEGADGDSGVFVAVPARSWKLHKLTIEVERKVGLAEV